MDVFGLSDHIIRVGRLQRRLPHAHYAAAIRGQLRAEGRKIASMALLNLLSNCSYAPEFLP